MDPLVANLARVAVQFVSHWYKKRSADMSLLDTRLKNGLVDPALDAELRKATAVARKQVSELLGQQSFEWRNLPDNERTAAFVAVEQTLKGGRLSVEQLLDDQLSSDQVRRRFGPVKHRVLEKAILSEGGRQFYDVLFEICVESILAILLDLSALRRGERARILARLDALLQRANAAEAAIADQHTAEQKKHADLLRQIRDSARHEYGYTEIFGVDVDARSQKLPLSSAWSSLRLHPEDLEKGNPGTEELAALTADNLFDRSHRIIVRGGAGSGKTTFMHWLMLKHSQDAGRLLPLYVQLRHHFEQLPSVAELLGVALPMLRGSAPQGWVEARMEQGTVAVLVDGLDEVPLRARAQTLKWVENLAATYPRAHVVVTTRPAGSVGDILRGFARYELEPMSPSEVELFAEQWHEARAHFEGEADRPSQDSERLDSFKIAVRFSRPLMSLASNPLLCAMMCALHYERRNELPSDRMELYRVAIEMLVWRRDNERGANKEFVRIGFTQRLAYLRDLAYWTLSNQYAEAERADVVDRIRRKSPGLDADAELADLAYRVLVERVGLLREDEPGKASWIHRTFEEFLAGAEVMDDDRVSDVIRMANEDSMREFVILAAGHANRRQRSVLIEGILHAADRSRPRRKPLNALAVACLETSSDLDPALRTKLAVVAKTLAPPRTRREATELVRALGDDAVGLLAKTDANDPETAGLIVYTLGQIGSDAAMAALAKFARDSRAKVVRELIRCWPTFDLDDYARIVLKRNLLLNGTAYVSASQLNSLLRAGATAKKFALLCSAAELRLVEQQGLIRLRRLSLSFGDNKTNEAGIDALVRSRPALEELHLRGKAGGETLHRLRDLSVERLIVEDAEVEWDELPPLRAVELKLRASEIAIVSDRAFPNVKSVDIAELNGDVDIAHSAVHTLSVAASRTSDGVLHVGPDSATALRDLTIVNVVLNLRKPEVGLPSLTRLTVASISGDRLQWISGAKELREIDVAHVARFDLRCLPEGVRKITVRGAWKVENLEHLLDLRHLAILRLYDCHLTEADMQALEELKARRARVVKLAERDGKRAPKLAVETAARAPRAVRKVKASGVSL